MSAWKIILATLVIFSTGLVGGGLFVKRYDKSHPQVVYLATNAPAFPPLPQLRAKMVERLEKPLDLSVAQRERIDKIIRDSHERSEPLMKELRAKMREESKAVRDQIRAELTPEQQKKFEEIIKPRSPRRGDEPAEGHRRSTTGATNVPRQSRSPDRSPRSD